MGGAPPMMPKSPSGGPAGPGSSPALSPGGGKGNQGAAEAQVKAVLESLYHIQGSFPVDSKQYGSVLDAIRALRSTFGKSNQNDLVPAAIQEMAQQSKGGKPFAAAQPAGMQAPGKPPTPPPMPMPPSGGM